MIDSFIQTICLKHWIININSEKKSRGGWPKSNLHPDFVGTV
jgi:hypothetical protein